MATDTATVTEREPNATLPAGPALEHKRLDVFVGRWNTQGRMNASPSAPAAAILGEDSYEWLEGGFFLVHRVDVRVGARQIKALELIGYDAASSTYRTHAFDSQGNYSTYRATVRDDCWTFTGESERATVVLSDAGDTMKVNWERSVDGLSWLPWMDVTLTKAR